MFALHPSVKVLVKLFQKLAGLGSAHKKRRFLFAKLFLCASCAKEKAVLWILYFLLRGRKLLKKSFSFPHTPILQEL